MLRHNGRCPFPSNKQEWCSIVDGLDSVVLQSHQESYFRALVLFSEAHYKQFKDHFAIEANVSQSVWDPSHFFTYDVMVRSIFSTVVIGTS